MKFLLFTLFTIFLKGQDVIPGTGVASGASSLFVTNPKTATYTVLASDFTSCKTIPVASGTFTITLVASASQPTSGQCITVINYGTGIITLARNGQNINGAASNLTGTAGSATAPTGWFVVSDGTNYIVNVLGGASGPIFSNPYMINGSNSYYEPGPLTPPPSLASWTWTNQGSATTTLVNGSLLLAAPAQSGDNLRCFFSNLAYPTTPWATSWTVGIVSNFSGVNFFLGGLVISDGTKLQTFGVGQVSDLGYTFASWNTVTSNSVATAIPFPLATITYLTLNDDGTNIDFWVSNMFTDLKRMRVYHASRTAFLTPSQIGIFLDPANSSPTTGGGSLLFVNWSGPVL